MRDLEGLLGIICFGGGERARLQRDLNMIEQAELQAWSVEAWS